jgi:hypothetical protein
MKITISHKISLAIATVVTIISGTTLPSHADRSCPLGFTSGLLGCEKVVKVTIERSTCPDPNFPKFSLRQFRDLCSKNNIDIPFKGSLANFNEGIDFVNPVADPVAKKKVEEELKQKSDLGFTNPSVGGNSNSQRRDLITTERVLINHSKSSDYIEVTFHLVISSR